MLRWQSLALILAASVAAFTDPSAESQDPSHAPYQCRAFAWVRAPDIVPGDVIAGDVKIKLSGPCPDAESYALGLRYKERIFWKLRREDAPIPKRPKFTHNYNPMELNWDLFQVPLPFENSGDLDYNETEWTAYQNSVQNKDLWSVHEEERIAFEIKTRLTGAEGANPLSTSFTTRFGILVPNTNYPPGVDYHHYAWAGIPMGETDVISGESIYEYFVEIAFGNVPGPKLEPPVDMLRSNYTIELSFIGEVYQNSSANITATVHRMGYTNRTDTPMQLCAFLNGPNTIEWHPQELKNRSHQSMPFIKALVPSKQKSMRMVSPSSPCREIDFAAAPTDFTREGHISYTSSEPLSLSLYVDRDTVPDFSTYYQKLGHSFNLNLHVKPDPSEPWEHDFKKARRGKQIADLDETDFDWVPWLSPVQSRRRALTGDASISVIPMHNQHPVRSTPVHYLSDKARHPVFVDVSDIADLRSMSPEERDLLAPFTQPSIKVFAKGEELPGRYFIDADMEQPIYVGDTWINKVLSVVGEGQRERDTSMDRLLVVQ
ncbi:hypothetical protein DFH29DRAFT_871255 [Suillus ampliporus]|nr:hypothetical protein DFH29DRAFT_871255 [Suillus ampliporus]